MQEGGLEVAQPGRHVTGHPAHNTVSLPTWVYNTIK
jgi:hypothetical protein